ncbi:MAG: hypothetical protein K9M11_00130 [Candidatus Pacebacteria bacterium]|nr:hypothetical protein [Candidatus Paceibacterota bacterium]
MQSTNLNGCCRNSRGLSILEVLIAVAIVSFVFIPAVEILYSIQPKSILEILSSNSATKNQYLKKLVFERGDLEVISGKGGVWKSYSNSNTLFTKQSCTDFNPIGFNSTTQDGGVSQGGSIKPLLYTYTKEELGISTTTILTGTAIIGQNLYISADSSSTTEPDILVYNISSDLYSSASVFTIGNHNTFRPTLTLLQSKETGPGISSIQSRGKYLVASNTSVKSQVDIFDTSLSKQMSLTILGSNSSTTPLTKVVLHANNMIVVGTEKSVLPEIHIFDINSGNVVRTVETGYGINDMVVNNNLLIVAGPRDPEIEVFELSTGQKIGQYDLPGGSGNAKVLLPFGDLLYVARTKGGNEFVVLDMSGGIQDLTNSTPESRNIIFTEIANQKINWSVDTMLTYEQFVPLFSADEYKEFQLYKISDTNQIQLLATLDLPARVTSAMCFKNTIWTTFRDPEFFNTNPSNTSAQTLGLIIFNIQ